MFNAAIDKKAVYGLSSEEARERLLKFGPNQIFKPARISFWSIARHEVTEPMILLLLSVGFFYSIWGKFEDAITIFVVIFLLVLAEVHNEYRAKKAIASLGRIAAPRAKVLRDGEVIGIETEGVVPGDILILTQGTSIPADAVIERSVGLQIDESALTGESFPQDKKESDEIYAGTIVLSGEGQAKVFATGRNTRFGKIEATLKSIAPPKTPLQMAMKSLAGKLVFIAVFFSLAIPLLGAIRGQDIKTMILTGLSLSFATIPEELPIIITMVLGLGAYALSRNKFLVKRLKAAETLGNATVIVTDKTGTITEGRMRLVSILPEEREKEVIEKALGSMSEYILSPMESEIKNKAGELKIGKAISEPIRERNLGEGNKKTKTVIRKTGDDFELFLSGAPEDVFLVCRGITDGLKAKLAEETAGGRRAIAVAWKRLTPGQENLDFSELERDMDFSGLISFEDPPKKSVGETIAIVAKAGIRTIMVTGDHPLTADFIARKVGISKDRVMTGKELDALSDEELKETVRLTSVFARTTPEHKYRIIKALQENGEVVAVTGDGINDILALKAADIGIAMGIKGTDVAKDAAEVILADDNYITITHGIFEGRKFFDNLQKGIKYYLSVKIALILIFLLPVLIGIPMPFSPIHIVVLELFMDLAASAGFVSEPEEKDIYLRQPRNRSESILSRGLIRDIFINGAVLFLAVTLVYFYARYRNLSSAQTQTFAFSAWIFGHIILAFISRSEKVFMFGKGICANKIINLWGVAAISFLAVVIYIPFLRERLNLAFVGITQLISIALVTSLIVGLLEMKKGFKLLTQKS